MSFGNIHHGPDELPRQDFRTIYSTLAGHDADDLSKEIDIEKFWEPSEELALTKAAVSFLFLRNPNHMRELLKDIEANSAELIGAVTSRVTEITIDRILTPGTDN